MPRAKVNIDATIRSYVKQLESANRELNGQRDELLAAVVQLKGICEDSIEEFNIPAINDLIAKVKGDHQK